MKQDTKKLVMSAVFAAFTCIATMIIKIPTPGTQGYIHPGDVVVILSGIMLGPVHGFFAAGIGSAMADLLSGYTIYAPATLVIKGLSALCGAYAYRALIYKSKNLSILACGLINLVFVVGGYFGYESLLYQVPAALASVPANLIQCGSGLILTFVLYPALTAVPEIKRLAQPQKHADCKK